MNILLDTHTLLFFLEDSPRLPTKIAAMIEDPGTRSHVSLASLWEIAIKTSLGKLRFDHADRDDLPELLTAQGFHLLRMDWPALRHASFLPQHHRDPFDRLLVAECHLRQMPILSCDGNLDAYGIRRLW